MSQKAGGRIISESAVVGKGIGVPFFALSVTALKILDYSRFHKGPLELSFDLSASNSAQRTTGIPLLASSSRSARSTRNLLSVSITTSSERSRGKVTSCDISSLQYRM